MMSDPGAFHNACAVIRSIRKTDIKRTWKCDYQKTAGKGICK